MPGGGCALPGLQPQITAGAGAAETAGAGGLNIAETVSYTHLTLPTSDLV